MAPWIQLVSIAVVDRSAAAARRDSSDDGPSSQSNQRDFQPCGKMCGGLRRIAVSGQTPKSTKSLCLRCPHSFSQECITRVPHRWGETEDSALEMPKLLPASGKSAAVTRPPSSADAAKANFDHEPPGLTDMVGFGHRPEICGRCSPPWPRCDNLPCRVFRGTSGGTPPPSRRLSPGPLGSRSACGRSLRR
jgi:hypothetical protein